MTSIVEIFEAMGKAVQGKSGKTLQRKFKVK